jgi:tRNA G10  N-methylase Trm11
VTVLAASDWATNAEMILDCHRLGYLNDDDVVLDPTWGNGRWWTLWQPKQLVAHNRDKDGSDFRNLPYPDKHFDAIAYDPPYCCVGGRKTTGIPEFHKAYGMNDAPSTPRELQDLINDGLTEMYRLVRHRGLVLCKTMDYVSSGNLWLGTHYTLEHALDLGFEVQDRFEHVGNPRPQPKRTRKDGKPSVQQHARRNLSTLFVLRRV